MRSVRFQFDSLFNITTLNSFLLFRSSDFYDIQHSTVSIFKSLQISQLISRQLTSEFYSNLSPSKCLSLCYNVCTRPNFPDKVIVSAKMYYFPILKILLQKEILEYTTVMYWILPNISREK